MARSKVPKLGAPVRGSRSGRPVMALLELLGRRWALRILWELRAPALTFRALQEACGGLSPSVLNRRLLELRQTRLVTLKENEGFSLSPLGRELLEKLTPLAQWSEKWARANRPKSPPR